MSTTERKAVAQRERELIEALAAFCGAHEESGFSSIAVSGAYLKAKRILRDSEAVNARPAA